MEDNQVRAFEILNTPDVEEEKKNNSSVSSYDLLHSDISGTSQRPSSKDATTDYDKSVGASGMAVGSFASNEKEWIRNAAKTIYPKEPVDQSLKRFTKTREGDWVHKADDGNMYKVRPEGAMSNIASGTGYGIPALTGTLGSAGGAFYGAGYGSIPVGMTFGASGDYMRQKIGDALMGPEVSTKDVNWWDVGKEGLLAGFGEGLNQLGAKFYNRLTAQDFSRFDPRKVNEAYNRSARFDVPITPAEATSMKSLQAQQTRLANRPSTANQMDEFEIDRNQRAKAALDKYLDDNFGRRTDASTVAKNASEIAQERMRAATRERTTLTKPLYQELEKSVDSVDTKPVEAFIDEQLKTAKGGVYKALNAVKTALQDNLSDPQELDTSFKGVQNVKMFVNDLLNDDQTKAKYGLTGLASQQEGVIGQVADLIDNSLKNAPVNVKTAEGVVSQPNNGLYEAANKAFSDISEQTVNPVREALNPLFQINPELGRRLTTAGEALFNENTRTPEVIKRARQQFVQAGQTDAWNQLIRNFMDNKIVDATKSGPKGRLYADKISNKFTGEYLDKNLEAAMHPSQYAAYKDIMKLFDDIASSTYKNTLTAYKNLEIQQSESQKGTLAASLSIARPFDWVKTLQDKLGENFREKMAQKAVDIVTSNDRSAVNKLRSLKTLKGDDLKKSSIAYQVLVQGGYLAPTLSGYGDPYSK